MIEIRPGLTSKNKNGEFICVPLRTKVLSLQSDKETMDSIIPGGLIGIGTDIDPYYCKNDNLSGSIIGLNGQLPNVYTEIKISYNIIDFNHGITWIPKVNDNVNVQIATMPIDAKITKTSKKFLTIKLVKPVCIDNNMMIIISTKINKSIHIVGYGYLDKNGHTIIL